MRLDRKKEDIMGMTIADLRKQRSTDFGAITTALNKKSEYAKDDEGFWKPERDKAGNASATIRFLPKHPDDELPWVVLYTHGFKGPGGKWYIDNCRSTIGEEDPVNVLNRAAWNGGDEDDKKAAKERKRKMSYICNILVVNDPKHPENDGKVFRYKFGKKIFEMIMDKCQPTFEDEKPLNVFDLWEGAEFKLRMRQVDGFPNYSTSTFSDPKPLGEDEAILAAVNSQEPLKQFVDPSKFKSYDELEKKLQMVMNGQMTGNAQETLAKMQQEPVAPAPAPKAPKAKAAKTEEAPAPGGSDDDLEDYFSKLANDE
jgi:hypothetical protein